MNFELKIENGFVTSVDGCYFIHHLAEKWADRICQRQWPNKTSQAKKVLQKVANYSDCMSEIVSHKEDRIVVSKPLTPEYLVQIGKKLTELFLKFQEEFEIPNVVEDGIYIVTSSFLEMTIYKK